MAHERRFGRLSHAVACLAVAAACEAPTAAPSTANAGSPEGAAPVASSPVTSDAASPTGLLVDAATDPDAGLPSDAPAPGPAPRIRAATATLDTSDWKGTAPGSTLTAQWTVDTTRAKPKVVGWVGDVEDDLTKHSVPLDLVLTLGDHSRALSFTTNAAPAYSHICSQVRFFYAGRDIIFELRRASDGRGLLTQTTTSESRPTVSRQLAAFALPADVPLSQDITTIAADGTRSSLRCTADKVP